MRHRKIHRQPRSKFGWLRNINIYKYLSIFLICIFIYLVPTVIKKLIRVNKIECASQYGSCTEDLGYKIYELSDYKTAKDGLQKLFDKNIQVDSYLIQYKIPSTIKIDLVLKKPKFTIKNLNSDYYLIDKDGLILDIEKESNLIVLNSEVVYSIGQKISEKDMFALNIIEKVGIISSISNSEIKNGILEIKTNGGILVKFPTEGDIDVLVGSLRLIFSRLNDETGGIRMEDVHEIDLRFKNTVLR
ncbi:MAG: hypothetical protein ACD_19C00079G0024 [uncultured bacterium]|nr:MAG: hypothetical protein ACD_19C00079G0024 [uncultured bacterium]